jgi:predicted acyltransferase
MENPHWMRPQWWGILGLIGWAYLLCSALYLLTMNQGWIIPFIWIGMYILNLLEFIPAANTIPRPLLIVSASNYALVISGVFATQIYLQVRQKQHKFLFPLLLVIPALILLMYGFTVRPLWGISKILATPSWAAICAGISYLTFAIIYVITDIYHFTRWAGIIMPAGRSTLTCYLLPGLVYPVLWPLQQLLPESYLMGLAGLLKSLLFALLVVLLTGLLERIKIKIRI